MLTLRSLLFTIVFFLSAAVGGTLTLLLFWAPFRMRWGFARGWAAFCLWAGRFFCGMRVVTEGAENIPAEPSVALIKHTTVMETYWQIAALPPQTWVLKRELLLIPLFGWAIGLVMKPIAINRRGRRIAVMQVIEQGRQRLQDGYWVSIFPEGTRVPPGETRRYGISGAALAQEVGCPIVPVAHNAGDFWPRRGLLKRAGTIRFCIGPPIDATRQPPKETNLIAQEWIESKMAEISALYPAPGEARTDDTTS